MTPTDRYLKKCFRVFTRFLKDDGTYTFVISHIFPDGRSKEHFFKDVRKLYIKYASNFGDVLHMCNTLGDYYRKDTNKNSPEYWELNIKPISEKWKDYFDKNEPYVEEGDFMA
jgi:hypothetical protein